MKDQQELSFEEAMESLEQIVEKLEEGDVPLEEAISIYKQGMNLSRLCHMKLKSVEDQLTEILNEDGQLESFTTVEEETP
ncbi:MULTISPECIES: exodeoxyribonuclease VII small subunit [Peribacillus]|uniref:exodeoxyribonuclease VII small subunit n=1 Tax=Peribacillus TaxID=2675229 RepID=UPI0021FC932B|nr:exodeoxyribonuclease VII small subunit [Peribacillus asahii]USK58743.1 exodeoxyribonuclease VII small subunit [Peribacillus asahii]USK69117.1 exodeoxyribonuclease VII small subunit [Peribacillus asahii]